MEYSLENLLALYQKGLTQSQIARELNVTKGSVKGKLSRLKKKSMLPEKIARVPIASPIKSKPNRYSIAVKPHKYEKPTKSELYDILKRAVENTK